jgi:periplasmic protein CpxP/Spy
MNTFSKQLLLLAAMAMFSVVTLPVAARAQSSAADKAQSQAQDAQQKAQDAQHTAQDAQSQAQDAQHQAQDAQQQAQDAMKGSSQATSVDSRLQMISDKLNLSDDQKTKLKPILQDESSQLKALKSDTSMTSQQKMDKAKEIRASHKSQIDSILTPDQQQKWQQMKDQAMDKMGHEQQEPH